MYTVFYIVAKVAPKMTFYSLVVPTCSHDVSYKQAVLIVGKSCNKNGYNRSALPNTVSSLLLCYLNISLMYSTLLLAKMFANHTVQ